MLQANKSNRSAIFGILVLDQVAPWLYGTCSLMAYTLSPEIRAWWADNLPSVNFRGGMKVERADYLVPSDLFIFIIT